MKLDRLEAAAGIQDLTALPGNRFEVLAGDRKGQFRTAGAPGPLNVEIVVFH